MISFQHFNEKCDIVQWGAMNTAWEVNCLATSTQCNRVETQQAAHPPWAYLTVEQLPTQ